MLDNEFNTFIDDTIEKIKISKDKTELIEILQDSIKSFVPYKEICFLSVDEDRDTATTMPLIESESKTYSLNDKGILSQCYQSHQPLLVNDIHRSLLFNEGIDCLDKEDIYKILVVPVLNNNVDKNMLGIVWIGIDKGFQQFIQQDIDNLVRFTNATKRFLFESDSLSSDDNKDSLIACKEAKKILQIKMKRLEEYFASTIHDIRTPMNAVIGFMELMMLDEKDEQKRSYINSTLKSGEHIIALINDALDMSKVASGKMTLDKTTFSPLAGFADVAKLFHNSMRKNSINFDVYIDPLVPAKINSDLYRIKQIINNLLSNALKFTPENGTVTFEVNYDEDKNRLIISVADTGIGIAKDRQKSIFSPYTQEKNSTCSKYGGTGLGLAISQQLSILLDGTLTLESEQGEGSKFTLMLPCETPDGTKPQIDREIYRDQNILIYTTYKDHTLIDTIKRYFDRLDIKYDTFDSTKKLKIEHSYDLAIVDREDSINYIDEIQGYLDDDGKILLAEYKFDSKECYFDGAVKLIYSPILPDMLFDTLQNLIMPSDNNHSNDEDRYRSDRLKDYKVLVVDDSMINLKLMSEVLKKFQLQVVSSYNPKEALSIFENETFNIVFIDQNMPIMNGDEAIMKMRNIEKERGLKRSTIYALTGDANLDTNEKMIKSGADAVFTKPLHINEIYKAVSEAIE
ncbi:Sensory transduction histidine kinase [hydrothermal vent metagenome]|uniref:histidine kinase n=1 Tax=hydrothermal vent metagenome TaxID=652676 RepID=A0A1W1CFE1_9ZZZZ